MAFNTTRSTITKHTYDVVFDDGRIATVVLDNNQLAGFKRRYKKAKTVVSFKKTHSITVTTVIKFLK